jgi:alanine racemase
MMDFYRDTWAEVNLNAIQWNIKKAKERLDDQIDLFAVVKADAYGHGMVPIANAALQSGATKLAVAFLDEALSLRNAGITAPILVLGASKPETAQIAAKHNIALTVFSPQWVEQAAVFLTNENTLKVHIKCDTGMGRLGVKTTDEIINVVKAIQKSKSFFFEGIFTHFATADEINTDYFQTQLETFHTLLDSLDHLPPVVHCANSATILRYGENTFNAVRFGIPMYGLSPSEEIKPLLPYTLQPAFTLHTKIAHVKQIHKGESISYGGTYVAKKTEWIATLPIGYADGWIRSLAGQEVLVNGERAPIVGRICMDQCMIRLSQQLPVGAEVILIGQQGHDEITVDEIARKLDTINYEIPCLISSRVPRVYKEHDEIVQIVNPLML